VSLYTPFFHHLSKNFFKQNRTLQQYAEIQFFVSAYFIYGEKSGIIINWNKKVKKKYK